MEITKVVKKKTLTVRHPLNPFIEIEVQQKCQKCGSFFINEKECEDCGFQFWVDLLEGPFGFRSFFQLKSDFSENRNFIESYFQDNSKKVRRYLMAMERRFRNLCEYFFESKDSDQDRRKLYLFEAKELIWEYLSRKGNPKILFSYIESYPKHPFFTPLNEIIILASQNKKIGPPKWAEIGEYKLWGVLRLNFVILNISMLFIFVMISLFMFKQFI